MVFLFNRGHYLPSERIVLKSSRTYKVNREMVLLAYAMEVISLMRKQLTLLARFWKSEKDYKGSDLHRIQFKTEKKGKEGE